MKQQRNTKQRQLVEEAVLSRKDHPSADQIYFDVRTKDNKISRGTVYRNLNLLAQMGKIRQVKIANADRFDWRTERHDHIVCRSCGLICDTPFPYDDHNDQRLEEESGFLIEQHQTLYYGICPSCRNK